MAHTGTRISDIAAVLDLHASTANTTSNSTKFNPIITANPTESSAAAAHSILLRLAQSNPIISHSDIFNQQSLSNLNSSLSNGQLPWHSDSIHQNSGTHELLYPFIPSTQQDHPHFYSNDQKFDSESMFSRLNAAISSTQLTTDATSEPISDHSTRESLNAGSSSNSNDHSTTDLNHSLSSHLFMEQMVAAAAAAAAAQAQTGLALSSTQQLYQDNPYTIQSQSNHQNSNLMDEIHSTSGRGNDGHLSKSQPSTSGDGFIIPDTTVDIPGGGRIVVRQDAQGKYCCHLCDHSFSRLFNLRSHMSTHSRIKPFQCTTCDKQFSRNHDLARHQRIHSKEKGHVCTACGRKFSRLDALKRHSRMDKGARKAYCADLPFSEKQSTDAEHDSTQSNLPPHEIQFQETQKKQQQQLLNHQLKQRHKQKRQVEQLQAFQSAASYPSIHTSNQDSHLSRHQNDDFLSRLGHSPFQLQVCHLSNNGGDGKEDSTQGVVDISNSTSRNDFTRAVMVIEEATAAAVAAALAFNSHLQ
ncbi:Metallothionein expression activator [Batrachochytrium dendrobatidis]|nr:Metallothionein expression activator [Batrachochytrium dendrobatidis]KAK5671208.1 Metallothionein expression activator [Batrachochytrium dendrobatidis]OAJ40109.1 hypothetical protein BDEG_23882 [Batrachochytrium dendrobatidis JEL423]